MLFLWRLGGAFGGHRRSLWAGKYQEGATAGPTSIPIHRPPPLPPQRELGQFPRQSTRCSVGVQHTFQTGWKSHDSNRSAGSL